MLLVQRVLQRDEYLATELNDNDSEEVRNETQAEIDTGKNHFWSMNKQDVLELWDTLASPYMHEEEDMNEFVVGEDTNDEEEASEDNSNDTDVHRSLLFSERRGDLADAEEMAERFVIKYRKDNYDDDEDTVENNAPGDENESETDDVVFTKREQESDEEQDEWMANRSYRVKTPTSKRRRNEKEKRQSRGFKRLRKNTREESSSEEEF